MLLIVCCLRWHVSLKGFKAASSVQRQWLRRRCRKQKPRRWSGSEIKLQFADWNEDLSISELNSIKFDPWGRFSKYFSQFLSNFNEKLLWFNWLVLEVFHPIWLFQFSIYYYVCLKWNIYSIEPPRILITICKNLG